LTYSVAIASGRSPRFLDGGWATRATTLDHFGLVWLLNGGAVVELQRDQAILETAGGALKSYQRWPVEVGGVVLPWELVP